MLSDCSLLIFFFKSLEQCPKGGLQLMNNKKKRRSFLCIYINYFDLGLSKH